MIGEKQKLPLSSREDMAVENVNKAIGTILKDRRMDMGLSQSALATLVGMSRSTITSIEDGRQNLMIHQIIAIAQVLRMTPSEIITNVDGFHVPIPSDKVSSEGGALMFKLTDSVKTR